MFTIDITFDLKNKTKKKTTQKTKKNLRSKWKAAGNKHLEIKLPWSLIHIRYMMNMMMKKVTMKEECNTSGFRSSYIDQGQSLWRLLSWKMFSMMFSKWLCEVFTREFEITWHVPQQVSHIHLCLLFCLIFIISMGFVYTIQLSRLCHISLTSLQSPETRKDAVKCVSLLQG